MASLAAGEKTAIRGVFDKRNPSAVAPTLDVFYSSATESLLGTLSPEQRKAWDEMLGRPFVFQPGEFAVKK